MFKTLQLFWLHEKRGFQRDMINLYHKKVGHSPSYKSRTMSHRQPERHLQHHIVQPGRPCLDVEKTHNEEENLCSILPPLNLEEAINMRTKFLEFVAAKFVNHLHTTR